MPEESRPNAQSALEYLLTYGWALVVIALLIGILIIASSGGVNKDTCSSFLNFICKDIGFEGDTVFIVLQNATGQKITINPFTDISFDGVTGYAIISYHGQDYRFGDITIGQGETFIIRAPGQVFARILGLTYTAENSGLVKSTLPQ